MAGGLKQPGDIDKRALRLADAAEAVTGFSASMIMAPGRGPNNTATIRHLLIWICRETSAASLLQIAEAFKRTDHGTVLHACGRVVDMLDIDQPPLPVHQMVVKICQLAEVEVPARVRETLSL